MMALAASLVVIIYFSIQYWVIKSADQQTEAKSNTSRPLLYSLSLAASGSSWMYYGSTSYAAKHGIEFAGLYIGIVLVFTLGFPLLRKIVQLAKSEGIKSISDFNDIEATLRHSLARLRSSRELVARDHIRGFIFDPETGELREVD